MVQAKAPVAEIESSAVIQIECVVDVELCAVVRVIKTVFEIVPATDVKTGLTALSVKLWTFVLDPFLRFLTRRLEPFVDKATSKIFTPSEARPKSIRLLNWTLLVVSVLRTSKETVVTE